MDLAAHFVKLLQSDQDVFEIVAPPQWALVVFRVRLTSQAGSNGDLDALNKRFWEALSSRSHDFALTQTVLPEVGFCIRLAVGSPQTEQRHIVATFQLIKQCAEEVRT